MAPIERITLFKIPNDEDLNRVLEQYKVLAKTAVKVRTYTHHNQSNCTLYSDNNRTENLTSSARPWAGRSPIPGTRASISLLRRPLLRWRICNTMIRSVRRIRRWRLLPVRLRRMCSWLIMRVFCEFFFCWITDSFLSISWYTLAYFEYACFGVSLVQVITPL